MFGQKLSGALLIIPRESSSTVRRELDVVRRICVDEIIRLGLKCRHVVIRELPLPERLRVLRKVGRVINLLVSAKRNVELAAFVEATQAVEARAIQIIEQLGSFATLCA